MNENYQHPPSDIWREKLNGLFHFFIGAIKKKITSLFFFYLKKKKSLMPCNRKKAAAAAAEKQTKETKPKRVCKRQEAKAKKETKKVMKAKKETKPKQTTQVSAATARRHLLTELASEAIASYATEEKPYVSSRKVYDYIVRYIDQKAPLYEHVKSLLRELASKKLVQFRKDSVAFTKTGEDKLKPSSIPKRKENPKPVEEAPKEVKQETVVTTSGRVSKQVNLD